MSHRMLSDCCSWALCWLCCIRVCVMFGCWRIRRLSCCGVMMECKVSFSFSWLSWLGVMWKCWQITFSRIVSPSCLRR